MSASNQKKRRQEAREVYMNERRQAAAKEAKKLRIFTITFWVVLALCLAILLGAVLANPVKNIVYSKTDAITIGSHSITSVELNYYYIDSINSYCNQYSSYISMILNLSKPLNEQIADQATGMTWADNFLQMAQTRMKSTYALYDKAVAEGYKLSDEERSSIDAMFNNLPVYAKNAGYGNTDKYLRAVYGNGADLDSYRAYYEVTALADSFYNSHLDSLEYTDEDLREYEKDKPEEFNSYTYASYYLAADKFLSGGKTEEGSKTPTYTEEQRAAAVEEAKKVAERLAVPVNSTTEALDKAIKALKINENVTNAASTKSVDQMYSGVNATLRDWLSDETRKEGDITAIPSTSTTTDASGNNVTTTNGYYVVLFQKVNNNSFPLANVRHILVAFQGGTTSSSGTVTYSDEEKAAAKTKAEKLLKQWQDGEKTEASFAALAKEKSEDPGSKANGGLYEDIVPGQMLAPFDAWCFDESRSHGDAEVIETTRGYHVMYYSCDSTTTYRDYMITNTIRSEQQQKWHDDLVKAVTLTVLTDKHVDKDLVIRAS